MDVIRSVMIRKGLYRHIRPSVCYRKSHPSYHLPAAGAYDQEGGDRCMLRDLRLSYDEMERRHRRSAFSLPLLAICIITSRLSLRIGKHFKEGLAGALSIALMPFPLFWVMSKIFPVFDAKESH